MNNKPLISVIIPVCNRAKSLENTLKSLIAQHFEFCEIIVVDDNSKDNCAEVARQYADHTIVNKKNMGPAFSRNKGIETADSNIIAFIDSDCISTRNWLANIYRELSNRTVDVIMGRTLINASGFVESCIAELGFPGGANAGFENMWRVDKDGLTDHITSCNFAASKEIFNKFGDFDDSFPFPGCEDSELSFRWTKKLVRIKYCPQILVYHEPMKKISTFLLWHFKRGRSNYYLKRKIGKVGGFIKLRIFSSKRIICKNIKSYRILFIIFLLFLSFSMQQIGFFYEYFKKCC